MRCKEVKKLIDMGGTVTLICDKDADHEEDWHYDAFQLLGWREDDSMSMIRLTPKPMEGILR